MRTGFFVTAADAAMEAAGMAVATGRAAADWRKLRRFIDTYRI